MLPFAVVGGGLTLYVLWALTAFPTQVYVEHNSIVYVNRARHNGVVAALYVLVTCGSLFFSHVRAMVIFGIANLSILLITMAVREYALHLGLVRLCSDREHHHLVRPATEQGTAPVPLCGGYVRATPFRSRSDGPPNAC